MIAALFFLTVGITLVSVVWPEVKDAHQRGQARVHRRGRSWSER